MNKWTELLLGMILFLGTILLAWASSTYDWTLFGRSLDFLHAGWVVFKGFIIWGVLFAGLALIILGINDLKD